MKWFFFLSETYLQSEMCRDKMAVFECTKKSTGKRRRGQCQDSKQHRFTSSSHVNKLLSGKQCCNSKCLSSVLTCEEIEECLSVFWGKTEEEQRAFILDYFFFNKNMKDNGKFSYEYKVNGKGVCQAAWKKCYGISNGR